MNPSAEMAAQDALADKSAAVQNARNKVAMLLNRLDRQKLSPEQLDYVDSVPAALRKRSKPSATPSVAPPQSA